MTFMKTYGGWIATGILVAVILYLIFRPVPTFNNSEAIKTIDSLRYDNNRLKTALQTTEKRLIPKVDSLNKASDSLKKQDSIKSEKINYILKRESATVAEYNRLKSEGKPTDSICDAAMKQKPIDSAITSTDEATCKERGSQSGGAQAPSPPF